MTDGFLAIVLGLVAAIGWGISGFFDAKSSRAVHPIVASFTVNGLLTLVFASGYFIFFHDNFSISLSGALYAASGGGIIAIGALSYFKALNIGPISLVSPMSSAYPLITTFIAVLFFNGALRAEQGVAIVLITLGIFAVTEFFHVIRKRRTLSRGPILGLFTALCWGIGYALIAQAVWIGGWQQATLIELIAMMLTFGICIPFLKEKREVTLSAIRIALTNKNLIIASMTALIAALSFNIGFSYDHTGGVVVATFSAFYPILTVLLALRHFKEQVHRVQLAGAGVSIAGVILLTFL